MKRVISLILCCFMLLAVLVITVSASDYRIRQLNMVLGTAGETCPAWANAIGNSGQVAGVAYDGDVSRAAVTDDHGDLILLDEGFVLGINSQSQMVGYAGGAALWDAGDGLASLPLPTGALFSQARSINDAGQIVGECWLGTTQVHSYAMLWNPGADPMNLGEGSGNSVNSIGWVAGTTRDENNARRSFLWTTSLGMVSLAGGTSSQGNSLNDLGQVAGVVTDSGGTWACLWDTDRSLRILDIIPDSISSVAWAINNSGAVAGTCDTSLGTFAVLWQPDGSIINLGQLSGDVGSAAYALNNSGMIAGCSVDINGIPRAVVWELVPEPGSILALLVGLVGLIPCLRRRH